ncbi:PREDICTED: uncharacterized protein LOC109227915 [Nicotiana attenuata]|uniref:uncharacterized protein LOC109227915 n=1 Tax=Nicotiana attenuata TaxID=49451 RepID=UPI00090512B3|nr:PREDICTED: uncharacterized protein LOC109227915 [Nicotiana attenuata]
MEQEIDGIKDLDNELHNLRKAIEEKLQSRNYQSMRYEDFCFHPDVELPPGNKLPKFNTFNGMGDPIAHLKDYCSKLIGIGHNESTRMRLFIQSLSGLALTWYTRQDFSKWRTWEDMASEYEFNIGRDPHMTDLLKAKKMPHESFLEYAMRWRLEASKIHLPFPEGELISTFIQIQEGIYFDKLLATCAHNFSDLIRIGNELECGILEGKVVGNLTTQAINQTFHQEIPGNLQSKSKEDNSIATTMHQPQCYDNSQFLQSYANSNFRSMHLQPNRQKIF